ncbi:FxLYD domain-containing protein [Streptomyces sp. NBC_01362]|uniref:FxLYD domain-containing protein n=1 Tax=Streptomyces sp. NBC_01362 TaxID=2903839 RepID=UPI002E378075|nr:FxLYD domain-containing protein [Streptomyces sp. NBC_01362]
MSYPPQPGQQPQQWQQQPGQYPPQQGPGWGAPMPPPKKSKTGLIVTLSVIGGLVVLGGCGAVVAGIASVGSTTENSATGHSPAAEAPKGGPSEADKAEEPAEKKKPAEKPADKGPEGDVKITSCKVNGSTTWPAAEVEIVNHSDEKANYIVSVEFVNAKGDRLGEGMAATNNLAPGQRSTQTAQGLDATSGKVECKVTDVSRYPSL